MFQPLVGAVSLILWGSVAAAAQNGPDHPALTAQIRALRASPRPTLHFQLPRDLVEATLRELLVEDQIQFEVGADSRLILEPNGPSPMAIRLTALDGGGVTVRAEGSDSATVALLFKRLRVRLSRGESKEPPSDQYRRSAGGPTDESGSEAHFQNH